MAISDKEKNAPESSGIFQRMLDLIEYIGNKFPTPFMLFATTRRQRADRFLSAGRHFRRLCRQRREKGGRQGRQPAKRRRIPLYFTGYDQELHQFPPHWGW